MKDTLPSPLANKKIILENCVFVPSYDCGESKSDSSIYFYHFGKTGGTTVGSFLRGLAYANDQSLLHLQDKKVIPFVAPDQQEFFNPAPDIVAGHALYGYHKFFGDKLSLLTVLREPVGRIISDFFFTYRNEDEAYLSDRNNFRLYLDNLARHNHMTNCMLGPESGSKDPWHLPLDNDAPVEIALERLSGFKYVVTATGIQTLMSIIASANGNSSMHVESSKVNPHKILKMELNKEFGDEILARNLCDRELVAFAKKKQRILESELSKLTSYAIRKARYIITDPNSTDGSLASGKDVTIIDRETSQWVTLHPASLTNNNGELRKSLSTTVNFS